MCQYSDVVCIFLRRFNIFNYKFSYKVKYFHERVNKISVSNKIFVCWAFKNNILLSTN